MQLHRYGEERVIRTAFATNIVAYIVLSMFPSVTGVVVSCTLSAYGNGALRPAISSIASQQAGADEQGTVLGLVQSLSSVAAILAPILGGLLLDRSMLRAWAIVPAVCSVIGLAIASRKID